MVLKLEICEDTDMAPTFAIVSSVFAHDHPYIDAVFPAHETSLGRTHGGERMLAMKNSDPNTTFLKVTDTESCKMVAVAKWNVYDEIIPDEADLEGDFWTSKDDKEYAQHMFREFVAPRRSAIRKSAGRLVCKSYDSIISSGWLRMRYLRARDVDICVGTTALDILTVDRDWQRCGAGRMLVKWGTAVADKMGVEAVVESTDSARALYESEGFKVMYDYVVDLPEKWAGRHKQSFIWMVRPVQQAVPACSSQR